MQNKNQELTIIKIEYNNHTEYKEKILKKYYKKNKKHKNTLILEINTGLNPYNKDLPKNNFALRYAYNKELLLDASALSYHKSLSIRNHSTTNTLRFKEDNTIDKTYDTIYRLEEQESE